MQVVEQTVLAKPFCRLVHFERHSGEPEVAATLQRQPVVLVVAPLSGHHATLLRDTVRTLLTGHDVYVTDWIDARMVPVSEGPFTLDDYVCLMREFVRHLGPERLHVIAVCQPAVPVLAATALMAAAGEREPRSLTLMGGSIDARRSPTPVTEFANSRSLRWFETHMIHEVPANYPARGRRVYPGFLQHAGFMAMNPLRHFSSHWDFYMHLVQGDLDGAEEHRRFYDEYNAVLDMPGEYYLDNIRVVFQQHLLPRGLWYVGARGSRPRRSATRRYSRSRASIDDISGLDQTKAALDLCSGIPAGPQAPPDRGRRRPLRHLQRATLAPDRVSARARFHRGGRCGVARPRLIRRTDRLDRPRPTLTARCAATKFTVWGLHARGGPRAAGGIRWRTSSSAGRRPPSRPSCRSPAAASGSTASSRR